MAIKEIYEVMLGLNTPEQRDIKMPVSQFTKMLRHYVATTDIKVITCRDPAVGLNQIIVSGSYDPDEDEGNFSSIIVYFNYHPDQKEISIKDVHWKRLCFDIVECVGHEIVHQTQYRRRDFDVGPLVFLSDADNLEHRADKEYYGDPDEIEAYGFSIALEMFLKHRVASLTSTNIHKSSIFKMYCKYFGVRHPIVITLLEFVIAYYTKLNAGTGERHGQKSEQLT